MIIKSLAVCAVIAPFAAYADPTDSVTAAQLFEEGRKLEATNNWAKACPLFEASLHLDPLPGTKLNLAVCYEKTGKLASAWSLYHELAEVAPDEARRKFALGEAVKIEPRLPRLAFELPPNAPAGLTVTRDGGALDSSALGTHLYADPGQHTIAVSAPGYEPYSTTVMLEAGKLTTVVIPPLEPMPVKPANPVEPAQPGVLGAQPRPLPPAPPPVKHWSAWNYSGIGVTGAGVALLAVGLVFGDQAKTAFDDEKGVCPQLACANQSDLARGQSYARDSRRDATISTALTIAGGIAVAGGVALWIAGPKKLETPHVSVSVTPQAAGIVFAGGF